MRGVCAALCLLAVSAGSGPVLADPIQAPGAPVAADPLMQSVDQAIAVTRQRNLDFQVHTPWQILHGLLALRNNYTLKNGDSFVNALDFISTSAKFKGERWFERTPQGAKAHPYNGTPYDFEGHVNQTLAIMAMCDLPLTHRIILADGSTVTMADMVRHAQWAVSSREETTWTLWLLTHYLDQDAQWTNSEGQQWSMESLVRIQTAASPYNAPCGGCHSLFALAYARNAYLQKHGKLQGAWLEADQKLQQYINASQSMMNRDGSFATQFYKARGFSNDFNERIKSSGHILEWLMVALPRKRLDEPWLRLGMQTLANDLIRNAAQPADCGPLYHSLHALILFKQRLEPTNTPAALPELAARPDASAGPLTLSAPDGESMPLSAQQQREATAKAAQIIAQPKVTAEAEPKTMTPGTPAKDAAAPSSQEFKTPVKVAEEPKPVSANTEAANPLKPAVAAKTPTLVAPPMTTAQALKPLQTAADGEQVRKLSADADDTSAKAETAQGIKSEVQPAAEIPGLTPVSGGMPILKIGSDAAKALAETLIAAQATAEKQTSEESAVPAKAEAGNEANEVKASQAAPEKEAESAAEKAVEAKVKNAAETAQAIARPARK